MRCEHKVHIVKVAKGATFAEIARDHAPFLITCSKCGKVYWHIEIEESEVKE